MLISDPRIPLHRRVRYAVILLAGVRVGEGSALEWDDYDSNVEPLGRLTISKQWDTKKQKIAPLKTAKKGIVVREMPALPLLARILAEWKLRGWADNYGRPPRGKDLIIPNPLIPGEGGASAVPRCMFDRTRYGPISIATVRRSGFDIAARTISGAR